MALLDLNKDTMGTECTTDTFVHAQEVLMRITQYSQPVRDIQMVCDHPSLIIAIHKQITDMQAERFLPPSCDHATFEQHIQQLRHKLNEARNAPGMEGTDQETQQELDVMIRDAQEACVEVQNLSMQIPNVLALAGQVVPPPPNPPKSQDRSSMTPRTFPEQIKLHCEVGFNNSG
ncbi:hypothetical protein BDD12DRAFT_805613 [Trichophaea hybrida]|nr:hypothetical protein BDD12DRAFT_805613 [Trichophaea hybrida]